MFFQTDFGSVLFCGISLFMMPWLQARYNVIRHMAEGRKLIPKSIVSDELRIINISSFFL